jgi:DUF917 family protein
MREVALDDIEALAVGAWILGTGGGGSPYLGLLNMRRLYAEGHRVSLLSPLDLADRSGSPTAATSRGPSRSKRDSSEPSSTLSYRWKSAVATASSS